MNSYHGLIPNLHGFDAALYEHANIWILQIIYILCGSIKEDFIEFSHDVYLHKTLNPYHGPILALNVLCNDSTLHMDVCIFTLIAFFNKVFEILLYIPMKMFDPHPFIMIMFSSGVIVWTKSNLWHLRSCLYKSCFSYWMVLVFLRSFLTTQSIQTWELT